MLPLRTLAGIAAVSLLGAATCREQENSSSPEPEKATVVVDLPGVDTGDLTSREKKEWSKHVTELLAPCPDQPVSLAQCVKESRACEACKPAADFLVRQVQRGKTRSQAEAAFRARFAPDQVQTVDISDSPAKGPADAAVTIVEWADFECPFCGRAAPLMNALVDKYDGQVRVVFKQYPLSMHPNAEGAARAAYAAYKQGKFWQMHKVLFENQEALSKQDLETHAKKAGLDLKKFREDMNSLAAERFVERDKKQAEKLGLTGTPFILINGRVFSLEQFDMAEDLEQWVRLEIKLRTGKEPTAKLGEGVGKTLLTGEPPKPPGSAAPEGSANAKSGDGDEQKDGTAKDDAKKPAPEKKK